MTFWIVLEKETWEVTVQIFVKAPLSSGHNNPCLACSWLSLSQRVWFWTQPLFRENFWSFRSIWCLGFSSLHSSPCLGLLPVRIHLSALTSGNWARKTRVQSYSYLCHLLSAQQSSTNLVTGGPFKTLLNLKFSSKWAGKDSPWALSNVPTQRWSRIQRVGSRSEGIWKVCWRCECQVDCLCGHAPQVIILWALDWIPNKWTKWGGQRGQGGGKKA